MGSYLVWRFLGCILEADIAHHANDFEHGTESTADVLSDRILIRPVTAYKGLVF